MVSAGKQAARSGASRHGDGCSCTPVLIAGGTSVPGMSAESITGSFRNTMRRTLDEGS